VNFSTNGKMLKSSGRRYSSSSESQAEIEGEDDDGENELPSSASSRCSSEPILSFGTRWDFWKYDLKLQYFETYAKSCSDIKTSSSLGIAART
jgi:hypothetical protein